MSLLSVPLLSGLAFGAAILGLGYLTRQGRALPFYATTLIVIALVYVLFAVMAGTPSVVWTEAAVAAGFAVAAVAGSRWPQRLHGGLLIAGALLLHGGFDLVHDSLIRNPVVPSWWPMFCAAVDVVLGAWLGMLVARGLATGATGGYASTSDGKSGTSVERSSSSSA